MITRIIAALSHAVALSSVVRWHVKNFNRQDTCLVMNDGNQNTREISFHGKSLEFTMCGHVGSP